MANIRSLSLLVLLSALAAGRAQAAPQVEVRFIDAARFSDATPGSDFGSTRERDAVLSELRTHLETLGQRVLGPHDQLTIEVLDVDLAGRFEPWRGGASDLRILRGITWPRLHLRTVLVREGTRTRHEERVADLNYQLHASQCRDQGPLCYEKRMLDEWFARRFSPRSNSP